MRNANPKKLDHEKQFLLLNLMKLLSENKKYQLMGSITIHR